MLNVTEATLEKELDMVAMAGKYIVYIEKSRMILAHPTGISFDLTQQDAMELAVLISNWQRTMEMGLYEGELDARRTQDDKATESDEVSIQISESLHYES